MTDSTLNNQLNEEESFDFSEITNYDKIKYQPANVFNNGTQKNSYFDWNTQIDIKDTYNTLYKDTEEDDEDFEFYNESMFDPSQEVFSLFTQADNASKNLHVSDGMLKYLGLNNFFDKTKNTKTPLRRPSDRIAIEKVFKDSTGFYFQEFLNNDIPKSSIETEQFQDGLTKVYNFYENKGFEIEIPERTNLTQFEQTMKGLGIEIGGGLSLDALTAPLLAIPDPYSKLLYGVINFTGGLLFNYEAQKKRFGQTGFLGVKDQINYGELFTSGAVQTIPFATEAKGLQGIGKSALFGGTLAGAETTTRTLIDEKRFPTIEEFLLSIGLGSGFAATMKGGLEGLETLTKKFAGKSADEINKAITKTEKEKVDKVIEDTLVMQEVLQQQPQANARGKDGFNIGETNLGDFSLPRGFLKMSPRYGSASLEFGSDIDKVAYILRGNRVKPLTEKQRISHERLIRLLEDQGIDVNTVRNHGSKIHQKIKDIVKQETGSPKATPDNTGGMKITVPTDNVFVKKVKQKTSGQDLGPTNLLPKQTNLLNAVDEASANNLRNVVKGLKSKGWSSAESVTDKENVLKALGLFDPNQPDFTKKVLELENSDLIVKMAEEIEAYGLISKQKEVNTGLAINAMFAAERLDNKNNAYLNALNGKNPEEIEAAINELTASIDSVKLWLMRYLKPSTRAGQILEGFGIKPLRGMEGKTAAEYVAAQDLKLNKTAEEKLVNTLEEVAFSSDNLKKDLIRQLEKAKQTGDYSELYRIGKIIQAAEGETETLFGLTKVDAFRVQDESGVSKGLKIANEIGINGMLYRFGTNTANFISATINTYHRQLKLFLGAENPEMFEAAMRHFVSLHTNYHFMRKAYKKSMQMEDNFINLGNRKYQNRFAIKSDGSGLGAKAYNTAGKAIRFSGRNMTATDAAVQAPNLIADVTYMAFIEAKRQGLPRNEIDKFIKKHTNAVLEWYAQNGDNELEPLTKRFLLHAKKQAKFATFTQDIDTTGLFGKAYKFADNAANKYPLIRLGISFTRTPANIKSGNFRNNPLFTPTVNPFNKQQSINFPDQTPLVGGKNLNLLSELTVPELRKQLNSPDPKIRAIANADINQAIAFITSIAGFVTSANILLNDPEYIPPTILTGGGPDFGTKDGAAMWKEMYLNGWRPYSIGYLQYDENGEPEIGEDGKPVYIYRSYEGWLEPLSGSLKMTVDTINSLGILGGKPYDDATTNLVVAIVQNLYNDSWTSQAEELINAMRSSATMLDSDGDPVKDYRTKKFADFIGRFVGSRLPFSGIVAELRRYPADLLKVMGFSNEEIAVFQRRPDTKVRAGDIGLSDDPTNPNYNKTGLFAIQRRAIFNEIKRRYGIGPDLPFDVEHITNEPILYPNRIGGNIFGISVTKKSKNYPIYTALTQIGKRLTEPKEYVTGNYTSQNFVPIRLDTNQYNAMKKDINTMKLNVGFGSKTILESMNSYLKTEDYLKNKRIIDEEGLQSENGAMAANNIFYKLSVINKSYIKRGEINFINENYSKEEQRRIGNYKLGIKKDYSKQYRRPVLFE
jgi:hypothetical protein